jgi:cholesterol oxidase
VDERFDAVVIGSGFGGSVMAYRLAAAGQRVCLLERGKPYPPGSFARTPFEMRNNFWDPSRQHYGLFNVWSFRHIASIVSAGLGGGSLIYANVMIRKDENWFVTRGSRGDGDESWPVTRAELDPHYDAVEKIQLPSVYPAEYQIDNKTAALRAAAKRLGIAETTFDQIDPKVAQWYLPLLAVTFARHGEGPVPGRVFDEGDNYHRAPRETCRLCGECDVGCTYGAKNTLDYTYVSHAQKAGADVRPLTEVKSFRPHESGKGYRVTCVTHDVNERTTPGVLPPDRTYELHADRLIVSCGTLGSTYLLLRMQAEGHLPKLSKTLGRRFSGNGDLLMLATRCTEESGEAKPLNASRAPVITSTFRFPDSHDVKGAGRGFYLQDAGYPVMTDYAWELLDTGSLIRRAGSFVGDRLRAFVLGSGSSQLDAQIEGLFGDARMSLSSMALLGMGRDVPDGRMSLRRTPTRVPSLDVSWTDTRSDALFRRVNARASEIVKAMGGRYTENPLTKTFNQLITVHPLGGCSMGRSDRDGVVDSYGRVFNYPGLYVADGAVMPGPVGANPSFTIAALSDRFAQAIIDGRDG